MAAHLLLPSFFTFLWYQVEPSVSIFIRMINHPPSARKASRALRRGRYTHHCYHKYKFRKKWKAKRSFRGLGMRHLGLRGAPVMRRRFHSTSTPNLKYMSATLWIMFYIYKFLCWIERLIRSMPACFAPWNIIPFIQYIKSYVLKSYVCASCVSLLSSPGKASVHPTRPTRYSPDMQGLRYVCRMANTMSQAERDIEIAYAASLDDFLDSEGDSSLQARQVRFDSDSYRIGIDTHATASISSDRSHFIDLKSCHARRVRDSVTRRVQAPLLRAWVL